MKGYKFKCNEDLFEVERQLKIPRNRIVFTKSKWKYLFFKNKNFAIHIDDLPQDIEYRRSETSMFCLDVVRNDWKRETNKFIKKITTKRTKHI